jgi:hypothetical protein
MHRDVTKRVALALMDRSDVDYAKDNGNTHLCTEYYLLVSLQEVTALSWTGVLM